MQLVQWIDSSRLRCRSCRPPSKAAICGALPEQEYVDLVRQAGFQAVCVRRSTSHGVAEGVPFYSVQVSAVKA